MTDALVSPQQFAALIAEATDDQLAKGLEANREAILGEIFRRMPDQLHAERAAGIDAVVEWQITGAPDREVDVWQLTIRDGRCTCVREGDADPDVTYRIGAVDFLKLVAGVEAGPRMFVFGRLRVRGDLLLAARLPNLFRMPRADAARSGG